MLKEYIISATFALICLSGYASAGAYAVNPKHYQQDSANAAASAITNVAAAKASAAKINSINRAALDHYGYQIGVPLLVKPYGPLTNLYAALAPKRSFVGTIDAGFFKDPNGNIKFADETAIGAIVI